MNLNRSPAPAKYRVQVAAAFNTRVKGRKRRCISCWGAGRDQLKCAVSDEMQDNDGRKSLNLILCADALTGSFK
jgi:hypothetical protein